jgi:hypothetical protein
MHRPINVKFPNNISKWQMGFNSVFKGLTKLQMGVYYSEIKIFNNLPHAIKDLANEITLFWNALNRFLLINSFYIVKNILIIRDNLENR